MDHHDRADPGRPVAGLEAGLRGNVACLRTRCRAAGAVIVRQRPGTAKGFVFLSLEDESGIVQAIVRPDLFKENRSLIVGSPGLVVEGKLQTTDGTLSVRADRFWPLPSLPDVPSHDFR